MILLNGIDLYSFSSPFMAFPCHLTFLHRHFSSSHFRDSLSFLTPSPSPQTPIHLLLMPHHRPLTYFNCYLTLLHRVLTLFHSPLMSPPFSESHRTLSPLLRPLAPPRCFLTHPHCSSMPPHCPLTPLHCPLMHPHCHLTPSRHPLGPLGRFLPSRCRPLTSPIVL